MKKHAVLLLTAFVFLLSACPNPGGGGGGDEQTEASPDGKTRICFVNSNDFPVTLYSDSSRSAKFTEAGANAESQPAETAPNPGAVFYIRYHILIDDAALFYDGLGLPVRIDAEKITKVPVPLLSELEVAELAKPLTPGVHIKIQNAGTFPLSLQRGSREEIPQGATSPIINSGETARYVVDRGGVSDYAFMKNTSDPLAFPAGLEEFLSGHLYSFKFSGNALALLGDKPLTIAQALTIQAPENIGAKSLANGHIALTWDKVGTETGYVIYRSESQAETYASVGRTEVTSYTDSAVTVGKAYDYRISAVKNNIESGKSATVVSARAEIGSLASPQGLNVTGWTENSVTLSWQEAANATGYKVYKGASAGGVNEYVAELASASYAETGSYTVTGLAANTAYYFAVSAVNAGGESLPSAAVYGKTAEAALAAPAGLSVTGRTQTSLTLSWQGVYGAAGYWISRSLTGSADSYSLLVTTAATVYTDTDLSPGTAYYYRVTAYNGRGESAAAAVSGTTALSGGTALAAPAGLSVTGQTETNLTLSWQGVYGAAGYRISRSLTGSADSYTQIAATTGTTYTDTDLNPGTIYHYRVTAYDYNGQGESAAVSGATISSGNGLRKRDDDGGPNPIGVDDWEQTLSSPARARTAMTAKADAAFKGN